MLPRESTTRSAALRAQLGHPVIDVDGHFQEFLPALFDVVRQVGGPAVQERYLAYTRRWAHSWYEMTPAARVASRVRRPTWWGFPAKNTRDLMTAMLPRLLRERLDELGIDFGVIYPTLGLFHLSCEDPELRAILCRAQNMLHAELFADHSSRLAPVALIPMHTPQEAIAELEFAVGTLGLKAALLAGPVPRRVPALAGLDVRDVAPQALQFLDWFDAFGIDSAHDYDPVWARLVSLGVAATFHAPGAWGARTCPSNYVFNHIGAFASTGELLCKSLFLGGVTRRFPTLRIGFLEGGVAWACSLFADLVSHWKVRNRFAVQAYNPALVDDAVVRDLCRRYGGSMVDGRLDQFVERNVPFGAEWLRGEDQKWIDEWAPCGIDRAEDIRDLFIDSFYFGCEGDCHTNEWAFRWKGAPFGARLKAMFGSDIGHWDVPDMARVLEEAHEAVDEGAISAADLRDFTFTNPAMFHAGMNPRFFRGTVVETAVDELLARTPTRQEQV